TALVDEISGGGGGPFVRSGPARVLGFRHECGSVSSHQSSADGTIRGCIPAPCTISTIHGVLYSVCERFSSTKVLFLWRMRLKGERWWVAGRLPAEPDLRKTRGGCRAEGERPAGGLGSFGIPHVRRPGRPGVAAVRIQERR